MNNKNLKRSVIKEELVLITKHRDEAAILNQFLYWTPKIRDSEKFIEEEKNGQETANFGWIYKKADDVKDELMMVDTNVKTVRKYLNSLVEKGYLLRRRNPFHKYDNTYQYRINLKHLVFELNALGHELEGFEEFSKNNNAIKKISFVTQDEEGLEAEHLGNTEMTKMQFEDDILDVGEELSHFGTSKMTLAIPDINTKIINKEYNSNKEGNKETASLVDSIAFNQIKQLYLKLSKEKFLKRNDEQHITDLLTSDIEVDMIVELMNQCYTQVQKIKNHKGIWSFNYFKKFIVEALKQQNDQAKTIQITLKNETLDFIGDTVADF
ncbi:hypothetical protein ACQKNC_21750 [Lysinibacillus sp. NPDC094177]|uniref:hypothetical protein n=1 Tax=Lysinibacillus sp. NPDC094177 TaxID=3390580 RepID=UPI003D00EE91